MGEEELLAPIRQAVAARVAAYTAAKALHRAERGAVTAARQRRRAVSAALAFAQQVAAQVQAAAHKRVADIVTHALAAVFDEPYEFAIRFEERRGRTEAVLVFTRNGQDVDPMAAAGGGVVDVAAFALRLSCLLLSRPPVRRLLVLDEPFRFVSAEYRGRVRELLVKLAEELDVQFIIVTHQGELRCGRVVEL